MTHCNYHVKDQWHLINKLKQKVSKNHVKYGVFKSLNQKLIILNNIGMINLKKYKKNNY